MHPSILIVEDDISVAYTIQAVLEDADCQTLEANTIESALHMVETHPVDLIVLDRNLPDGRGDYLCQKIKSRPDAAFLPILMLTAQSAIEDRVTGLQAGADDYLTKPFHIDELLARVRALLRIRRAEVARLQALDELQQQHQALKTTYEQLRAAQAQLIHTSKLAALGSLVAGVTHELNNPLAIILGNAELLQTSISGEDAVSVRHIIDATQRARRVVQSLASFARQGPDQKDWYEPRDLLDRVLDVRRATLERDGITVAVTYCPNTPMICVNRQQFQHALLNLLLNAEQALPGRPNPRIELHVHCMRPPIPEPPILPDQPDTRATDVSGDCLLIIDVMDNGPGIAESIHDHLFEPFVTTHPQGQWIGLGLSTTYGIIAQHGGQLIVSTQRDRGTTFRIALASAPMVR
ncbi:MAG TPA: response regulator [Roseiflexaceae bacterium]|nr:response regulator [Roseiflexaceae bacterium]